MSLFLIFLPRVQVSCSVWAAGKLRCSLQSHKHVQVITHNNLNSWRTPCPTQSKEHHGRGTALTPSSQDQGTSSADCLYVTCKLLKPFKASGFSCCHSKFNYTWSTCALVLCSRETLNRGKKPTLKQVSPYSIVVFPASASHLDFYFSVSGLFFHFISSLMIISTRFLSH